MQDIFRLNILHFPSPGGPCNTCTLQCLKSVFTLNECTKLNFLRVWSFRCSEKFSIFEIFVTNITFGFFLKPCDSVYVSKDHTIRITSPFWISLSVKKVRIKPAIAW